MLSVLTTIKSTKQKPTRIGWKNRSPARIPSHEGTGLGLVSGEPEDMETAPRTPAFEPANWEAWPEEKGYVPKVGRPVPHHLVFLQRQPLNHALAIFHELAVERFFNRSNSP